ncbi:hypothetical protein [Rosettibacter primus]|uniref:hypothetical protein n=1 Tax=Rosettibacter primus TaxID=3111523 RepID=UPI00336BB562
MNKTDDDRFYKGKYIDEIIIVNEADTSNIVIEQFESLPLSKDSIPYSFKEENNNSDLITLRLFVSYGSYSQTPKVIKEANMTMDTIYIWYASREKIYKTFYKNNSIIESIDAPKLEFITIDSIVIQKSINKVVNIFSRFKKYI